MSLRLIKEVEERNVRVIFFLLGFLRTERRKRARDVGMNELKVDACIFIKGNTWLDF